MKYGVLFVVVGAAQVVWGLSLGGFGVLLVWSGVAWAAVGTGYLGLGPRLFGKRTDGSMSTLSTAALLPFLAVMWSVWRLGRRRGKACGQKIADGLWLGRRPLRGELPDEITAVVDLTSEFPKSRDVRDRAYLCRPLLDATAPDLAALTSVVEWIGLQPGPVYVHCAAGHGRSAAVVAAVLVARGEAPDAESAVALVRAKRPAIGLNAAQLNVLMTFAQSRSSAPR